MGDSLKNIYFDSGNPGSFGGVERLSKAANVSKSGAKKWLAQQDVYTLHKPVRYKYQRRSTIAYGVNELWQADLLEVRLISKFNANYNFILTVIDVFSRFLRVVPIKNKKGSTVAVAFSKLFRKVKPVNLQTDKGTEFYNSTVRKLFKKHNIHHYSTQSGNKCAILERLHRTLRARLYRIFTYRNSYKWRDVLQNLVDSYNNTVHSAHGFKPIEVSSKNEKAVYKRLYGINSPTKFRFKVGDIVRISKVRKIFRRGYFPGWSEETFKIYKVYPTSPPTYILEDFNGKEIEGRFYAEELQKIKKSPEDSWAIETILRSKGRKPYRKLLVKWVGFDDTFNSWINEEWIKP